MLLDQNYIKNYLVPQHLKKKEENTFSMWTPHLEKLCTILSNLTLFPQELLVSDCRMKQNENIVFLGQNLE